jgi:hypothetical protein
MKPREAMKELLLRKLGRGSCAGGRCDGIVKIYTSKTVSALSLRLPLIDTELGEIVAAVAPAGCLACEQL